jgi:hypothetical protein
VSAITKSRTEIKPPPGERLAAKAGKNTAPSFVASPAIYCDVSRGLTPSNRKDFDWALVWFAKIEPGLIA